MQDNRGGSWSQGSSANGRSGNGNGNRNGGYLPQATTRVFPNFNGQQPIRYNFQTQHNLNFPNPQIPSFLPHQFPPGANVFLQPNGHQQGARTHGSIEKSSRRNVDVMRIDKAVIKTRKSLVASGENVSSTRVSQLVLAQLQAASFGVQLQDVPSLLQLMTLEGKIDAFIHCFIGARRIVTLHDLEVAICGNESVDCFDDLELGPLLQHPLVLLYFPSVSGDNIISPVKITSEEIISFLDIYLNTYDTDDVKLDEFLNFVAEKKSVTSKEKLGVRIPSLRMYVSFIQEAKRQEGETLEILLTELYQKYHMISSKIQRQDKSGTVSEHADSFALHRTKDYCGKHTRFYSSDSDDSDSDDYEVENVKTCDDFSRCPYPSVSEEMKRHGGSNKKRKAESSDYEKSNASELLRRVPSKLHRRHAKQETPKSADEYSLLHVAKELVTEALEEQIPIETTDTNLVAGNGNCAGTSSRANKPNPLLHMTMKSGSTSGNLVHEWNNSDLCVRDQFLTSTLWATQAQQTGKKGEEVAYRHFLAKYGKEAVVRWVNKESETGLPYDLIIENRGGGKKVYVEVKATVSTRKENFNLTVSEWQFAIEKGESYVIAHVLLGNSKASLTQHRNLVKLCHEGHLRLLIEMPKPNQRDQVTVPF